MDLFCPILLLFVYVAHSHGHGQSQGQGRGRHHGKHKVDVDKDPQNRFNQKDFVRDADHIKDHMDRRVKFDPEKVSPQELDFHFFKIHDLNEDHQLDGLEILSAVSHAVDVQITTMGTDDPDGARRETLQKHLVGTVDRILEDDDTDADGYLSYAEYASARQAAFVLKQAGTVVEQAGNQN